MRLADLQFSSRNGLVVARVVGEIDVSNARELASAVTDSTPNDAHGAVLDLTDVDYLDSAGIHLLYRLGQSLRTRGQSLMLVIPAASATTDALRLAGVQSHLDVVETLAEALGEVPGTAG